MNRSHRVAITVATASVLAAGAGRALASTATTSAGPAPAPPERSEQLDAGQLQDAVTQLAAQAQQLQSELTAARHQLDALQAAAAAAPPAAAVPAPPAVHARTGASSAGGEGEGDDD
jgi:Tfp pilus assembly protein FimV